MLNSADNDSFSDLVSVYLKVFDHYFFYIYFEGKQHVLNSDFFIIIILAKSLTMRTNSAKYIVFLVSLYMFVFPMLCLKRVIILIVVLFFDEKEDKDLKTVLFCYLFNF